MAGALALPVLRHAVPEVVAGAENLERVVRWVHIVDVPEPDDLLRGGELVLSTGLGPGDDPAAQRQFIRSLSDQGAAGLVIELGYTYRRALPPALIAEARARGLPLIATHRALRFVDITEAIHGALVDRRLSLLRRSEMTGDRLTTIVLERRGLGALLGELALTVQNPVMLENIAGQLVSFAVYETSEQEMLEARDEHRRARDPSALRGRGWLATEVRSRGQPWGHLTALELDSPLLAEAQTAVLERGAVAVALELLYEQHDEQLRARARGTFLVDLIQARMQEEVAARRAAALEFPVGKGRLLAAALGWRSERWVELADTADDAWATLMPSLRVALGSDRRALLGLHDGRLLVVCSVGEGEPDEPTLVSLATDLRRPLERLGLGEADAAIAIARSEPTWIGVGRELGRASDAVMAARATAPSLWRDARRGSLVDLLYALRRSSELLAFAREQLGSLFEASEPRGRELLQTLEAYLASSGGKAQAARALHLSRQSLYLRLARIEALLGVDLDDPEALLTLHLAVRALRLTQALAPDERL